MDRKEIEEAWDMMLEATISLDEAKSTVNRSLLEFDKALERLKRLLDEAEEEAEVNE